MEFVREVGDGVKHFITLLTFKKKRKKKKKKALPESGIVPGPSKTDSYQLLQGLSYA